MRILFVFAPVLAIALASCSPASPPASSGLPPANVDATALLSPDVTCPVEGKTYSKGKSFSTVQAVTVDDKYGPVNLIWRVTFKGIDSAFAPVGYEPAVGTCGERSARKPIGTVRVTGGSVDGQCHNGVCTVVVEYRTQYTPPTSVPGGRPWRFDTIRFIPTKRKPPYGPLPAFRIAVRNGA